jgi:hypothetical protein
MSRRLAGLPVERAFARFGEPARYLPSGGGPGTPVRVLVGADGDEAIAFGQGRPLGRISALRVRAGELTPRKGGVFDLFGENYVVVGEPRLADRYRLVWSCKVDVG